MVGTPGRIIDHIERGTLKLDKVRIVVLDEADEMISMGFREDMETILASVPEDQRNIWLFSATMSPSVRKVADAFLTDPQMVQVNRSEMLSSTVEQIFYMTHEGNKPEVLCKLIDAAENFYGIIFCQTKSLVTDLTRYLTERGYKADCLHGDMSQTARETSVKAFRERRMQVIVCTDVASRGLDVKDITHVVNYSLPRELDSYVHRIGRTARSGKAGVAMSLVTPSHRHLLQKIERMTRSRFTEGTIPSRKMIGMKKIGLLLPKFTEQPDSARAMDLMDESWKSAVATMSSEEVAARFLSMMFPWVFSEKDQPKMTNSSARAQGAPSQEQGRSRAPRAREANDAYRDNYRRDKRDAKKKFSRGFKKPHRKGPGAGKAQGESAFRHRD